MCIHIVKKKRAYTFYALFFIMVFCLNSLHIYIYILYCLIISFIISSSSPLSLFGNCSNVNLVIGWHWFWGVLFSWKFYVACTKHLKMFHCKMFSAKQLDGCGKRNLHLGSPYKWEQAILLNYKFLDSLWLTNAV